MTTSSANVTLRKITRSRDAIERGELQSDSTVLIAANFPSAALSVELRAPRGDDSILPINYLK
jgi:hypothetical protein